MLALYKRVARFSQLVMASVHAVGYFLGHYFYIKFGDWDVICVEAYVNIHGNIHARKKTWCCCLLSSRCPNVSTPMDASKDSDHVIMPSAIHRMMTSLPIHPMLLHHWRGSLV